MQLSPLLYQALTNEDVLAADKPNAAAFVEYFNRVMQAQGKPSKVVAQVKTTKAGCSSCGKTATQTTTDAGKGTLKAMAVELVGMMS